MVVLQTAVLFLVSHLISFFLILSLVLFHTCFFLSLFLSPTCLYHFSLSFQFYYLIYHSLSQFYPSFSSTLSYMYLSNGLSPHFLIVSPTFDLFISHSLSPLSYLISHARPPLSYLISHFLPPPFLSYISFSATFYYLISRSLPHFHILSKNKRPQQYRLAIETLNYN